MDDMKHEHGFMHDKHKHMHGGPGFWASWCSPIGLGVFFLTTALAAAIALYTLITLISGIMSLARPAPSYSYPTTYPSDMQMPTDAGAEGTMLPQ